jgi:hypothetical protein
MSTVPVSDMSNAEIDIELQRAFDAKETVRYQLCVIEVGARLNSPLNGIKGLFGGNTFPNYSTHALGLTQSSNAQTAVANAASKLANDAIDTVKNITPSSTTLWVVGGGVLFLAFVALKIKSGAK